MGCMRACIFSYLVMVSDSLAQLCMALPLHIPCHIFGRNRASSPVLRYHVLSTVSSRQLGCNNVFLLRRRVLDELNTLGDVALEAVVAGLKQLLLVVVRAADNVDGLLGTVRLVDVSFHILNLI